MKNILCFGDSNTFGTNPSGGRWPRNQRWTGILQERLGNEFYVMEEGLGGRTAAADASRHLAPLYRAHAEDHGWLYLDAASVAGPSDLDQLHLEACGHRALAEAVEAVIRKYF